MTFFFDWYTCTIRDGQVTYDLEGFAREVADGLGGSLREVRALRGYEKTVEVRRDDRRVGCVMYGGANRWPCVEFSSDDTEPGVELVRARWPHTVSRVDSSVDYVRPGHFQTLRDVALEVARDRGVGSVSEWVNPLQPDAGGTLYLGAKSSDVRLRIYDKTAERRAALAAGDPALASVPDGWVRMELQVRPKRQQKTAAAFWDAEQCWGAARWSQDLLERVTGLCVDSVRLGSRTLGDDEQTLAHMLRQYHRVLMRKGAALGGYEQLGAWIGRSLSGETENVGVGL